MDSVRNVLLKGLCDIGINADTMDSLADSLLKYIDLIKEGNKRHNIVGTSDDMALAVQHMLDSISALPYIGGGANPLVADIGSGAGLPGIPLALALPNAHFILVERMTTRCDFLRSVVKSLALTNVKVLERDARDIKAHSLDVVVLRAFKPLTFDIVSMLLKTLSPQGTIVALKGRRDRVDAEVAACNIPSECYEVHKVVVPFLEDHERHIVVIHNH